MVKTIFLENENGTDTTTEIAWVADASPELVDTVLEKPVSDDGRSQFKWFRLQNGSLILGVFPRGDTYFEIEQRVAKDFEELDN